MLAGASPACAQLFVNLQPISCSAPQAGSNGVTFYELFWVIPFSLEKELLLFVLSVISSA